MTTNKQWIKNRKKMLEILEEKTVTKTTDRLEILQNWILAHNILAESLYGWSRWLNNIVLMEQIDRKTLKDLYLKYKKFTEDFVKFDINATKTIDKKLNKKKKVKIPEYAI